MSATNIKIDKILSSSTFVIDTVASVTNTTDSVSSVTGAVITAGGLGVAKALYVGTTIFENNVRIISAAGSNLSKTGNTLDVISNPTFSGVTTITNTTDSVSSVTGAVITAGGLGVAKALYVGTTIFENNVRIVSAAGSNLSKTGNTLDVISNPTFSGVTTITNTTESNNTTSGSLIVSGGVGIVKNLYVGGSIFSGGASVARRNNTTTFIQASYIATESASSVNVNGLLFSNIIVRAFTLNLCVNLQATSNLYAYYTIKGVNNGSSWNLNQEYIGDIIDVTFSITGAGQIQYNSGTFAGFLDLSFTYNYLTLEI
jgi:hypothetical protein